MTSARSCLLISDTLTSGHYSGSRQSREETILRHAARGCRISASWVVMGPWFFDSCPLLNITSSRFVRFILFFVVISHLQTSGKQRISLTLVQVLNSRDNIYFH
ncbi:uncharacterized protein LOC143246905 isoform X1 [Tachypleus tridentatus]|uniref:uncharacterized protein LOC143246905 isoform X1 n=1 Tax=Tachypleus tridentatus TaxID=6853 RepID=UPI003FD1B12B